MRIEGAAVADRQHVDRHTGGIGKLHRPRGFPAVERIDFGLFDERDGRCQIFRILVERAQENEHVVGRRAVDETIGRHRSFVAGR